MNYLVVQEIEVARWEPLGVIEVDSLDWVGVAIARLDWDALPGVFRLVDLESDGWLELELYSDGVPVEP